MILYDKLKERYSRKELSEILGSSVVGRIWRKEKELNPSKISSKLNMVELGYSLEEFLVDYSYLYGEYMEKEMIYKLLLSGYSISTLKSKFNLETMIYNHLKKGFDYNSQSRNLHLVFDKLGIKVDTSKFKIDVYPTHIELFATKEELESFKNKYQIKYDIYWDPYIKSWHLAFNGCLAEYIKAL